MFFSLRLSLLTSNLLSLAGLRDRTATRGLKHRPAFGSSAEYWSMSYVYIMLEPVLYGGDLSIETYEGYSVTVKPIREKV